MLMGFLPPYPQILNPIEELYSAWRWKVYDRQPRTQMTLLAAMDVACEDITVDGCRGWIRHSKRFLHIAREDIRCDVDDNLWSDRLQLQFLIQCSQNSAEGVFPVFAFLIMYFNTCTHILSFSITMTYFFVCGGGGCTSKTVTVNHIQSLSTNIPRTVNYTFEMDIWHTLEVQQVRLTERSVILTTRLSTL